MRILLITLALVTAAGPSLGAQPLVGGVHEVTVTREDTLRRLGSRFGVDPPTIADDNAILLDQPLPMGMTLTIDNRHIVPQFEPGMAIVVNLPQRMLFVASAAGVAGYPVAVGQPDWRTPLGAFSITTKETHPTWDVPESIRAEARRAGRSLPLRVPPGPNNPLGKYWLGLSLGSVGIHGTNAPNSVYQVITHGCIRMQADAIAALFGQVMVGSTGDVRYEPLLMADDGAEVFLEAHPDVYSRGPRDAHEFVKALARALGVFDRVDWSAAARVLQQRDGVARAVTRR